MRTLRKLCMHVGLRLSGLCLVVIRSQRRSNWLQSWYHSPPMHMFVPIWAVSNQSLGSKLDLNLVIAY